MFAGKTNSKLPNKFAAYRRYTHSLIGRMRNLLHYLESIENKEEYSKDEILKTGIFGSGNRKEIEEMYDKLSVNLHRAKELTQKLIQLFEEENNELEKHFNKVQIEEIDSIRIIEQLLISYNQKISNVYDELITIVPHGLLDAAARVEKIETISSVSSAGYFVKYYEELKEAIESESITKGGLYESLSNCLIYLGKYIDHVDTLISSSWDNLSATLDKLKNNSSQYNVKKESVDEARIFLKNFSGVGGGMSRDLLRELNTLREKTKDKAYNDLEESLQKKVDAFLKESLNLLFGGEEQNFKNIRIKVEAILKLPTNWKDIQEKWKNLSNELSKGITNARKSYVSGKGFKDLNFVTEKGEDIDAKQLGEDIKEKKEDKKGEILFILNYLELIIYQNGGEFWKKDTFKDFLGKQTGVLENVTASSSGSGSSGNEDEKARAVKNYMKEILSNTFGEGITIKDLEKGEFDTDLIHLDLKQNLVDLFEILFPNESSITKDADKYSSGEFLETMKNIHPIDKKRKEEELNTFLRFCYQNFASFEQAGTVSKEQFSQFIVYLLKIVPSSSFS